MALLARSTFQYMLLLRGATPCDPRERQALCFNTCSSCEEQPRRTKRSRTTFPFQYMLLLRGATMDRHRMLRRFRCFNTCSSCEEQLFCLRIFKQTESVSIHAPLARSNPEKLLSSNLQQVSIHAPLARSNFHRCLRTPTQKVSIHAPLARSNHRGGVLTRLFSMFQYMLLLRGAT